MKGSSQCRCYPQRVEDQPLCHHQEQWTVMAFPALGNCTCSSHQWSMWRVRFSPVSSHSKQWRVRFSPVSSHSKKSDLFLLKLRRLIIFQRFLADWISFSFFYSTQFVLTLISTSLKWNNGGEKLLDRDERFWIMWGHSFPLSLAHLIQKGQINPFVT